MVSSVFIFPMMFPMMLLPLGMDTQGDFNTPMLIFFVVLFPIIFLVMYVVQGILMAFFQSAWAVAYLRMNQNDSNAPIALEEKP